jgi:hypothetical protein
MRQFEVITSGVNRLDGRLQPTQPGASSIWRDSVCIPDTPDVVVAKLGLFGFVGMSFKTSIHWFTIQLGFLSEITKRCCPRNSIRWDLMASRTIPVARRFPQASCAATMNLPNVRGFFLQSVFMVCSIDRETARMLWGVHPMGAFRESNPTPRGGAKRWSTGHCSR